MDHGAIVVGAGHNGLVCAAYLARAGIDTLLVDARTGVGGCASTVDALCARVNVCSCDHTLFRTTPVMDELGLARHGLRYLDVEPASVFSVWDGGPPWPLFHDPDRTVDAIARLHPGEADGYRRYLAAALPAARLVLELAATPPTAPGIVRKVLARRARGAATILSWGRRSVADVVSAFFATDDLRVPAIASGPAVWGVSPRWKGTGLGALGYALRHAAAVGRPVGGSGAVPAALAAAFTAAGGRVRLGAKVTAILCEGERVRGVELAGGEVVESALVVAACDPRDALVRWLRDPPPGAAAMLARWRDTPHRDGYESKLDAVVDDIPRFRRFDTIGWAELGVDDPAVPTHVISPGIEALVAGHALAGEGRVMARPVMFCNLPDVADPAMRPPGGGHVFSLEVLWTPYALAGGWDGSAEPRRWLELFAAEVQPGWLDGVRAWRAMTPPEYERQFHLPRGYATSFSGGPLAALRGRPRELTRYETPVRGLWLTGAATFPGAGVWGAAGRNAALTLLAKG